jgi:uncharacterized protein (TIGR03437 family)
VQVDPSAGVTAQFIQTWLPSEQKGNIANRMVADTWNVAPALAGTASGPAVSSVVNAASGTPAIAPNTWTTITGANLAKVGDSRSWAASDFVIGTLPTTLDGVSVTVNGARAYVSYISPTQINFLTPPGSLSGSVAVQVTVNGLASTPFNVTAQPQDPAFFRWGNYAVATHSNFTPVGPATLFPGQSTPARAGQTIVLWANGLGPVSTPVVPGAPTQSGSLTSVPVVRIGGQSATVTFAGLVSDGLYQINVTVPAGLGTGDVPVTATVGGAQSPSGLMISLQ